RLIVFVDDKIPLPQVRHQMLPVVDHSGMEDDFFDIPAVRKLAAFAGCYLPALALWLGRKGAFALRRRRSRRVHPSRQSWIARIDIGRQRCRLNWLLLSLLLAL